MSTDIDEHLDEVLGVIELPKKEITKVHKSIIIKDRLMRQHIRV